MRLNCVNGLALALACVTWFGGSAVAGIITPVGHVNDGGYVRSVAVLGRYAYLASEDAGLQIYDISDPAHPVSLSHTNNGGSAWAVTVAGHYAYLANFDDGLRIYDIANPASPANVGHINDGGQARGVAVDGQFTYVANYDDGLRVYNTTNPATPISVGHTNNGAFALSVVVANGDAYVANDSDGLRIYWENINNPGIPQNLAHVFEGGMAKGVTVGGHYAYLANGNDGLRIYDVSDPELPTSVGHINEGGQARSVALAGNYALLANLDDGLRIYDVSDPTNPLPVGHINEGGSAYGVAVEGGYVFLATEGNGLRIYQISLPVPKLISGYVRRSDGTGMSNVTINGLPGSPVTDSSGFYSVVLSNGWSGTAIPSVGCYAFNPAWRTYSAGAPDQTGQDFIGTPYATSVVTNLSDAGPGTLRQAMLDANAGCVSNIVFSNVTGTITLLSPLPTLNASVTITGPGTNLLTVSGNSQVAIFSMNPGTTNVLSGLTVADGWIDTYFPGFPEGYGAGISNAGSLKLLNCLICDCMFIEGVGVGIYNEGDLLMEQCQVTDCGVPRAYTSRCYGGGIGNWGDLRMKNCTVSDCQVHYGGQGGGIANFAKSLLTNCIVLSCAAASDADGGGVYSEGDLTIHSSVVSNCVSAWGGGIQSRGSLTLVGSSIVNNVADYGAGLWLAGTNVILGCTLSDSFGAGIFLGSLLLPSFQGDISILNCTISGNRGPGVWGDAYVDHCTIVSNTATTYGGGVGFLGSVRAQNSIFAWNGTNGTDDISGVLTSEGYNLIHSLNGCTISGDQTGNLYGVDPLLGPLQDNGGPTWTHALMTGSPAIDSGTSGGLTIDQRGVPRNYDVASIPNVADGSDIGAYEYGSWFPVTLIAAPGFCGTNFQFVVQGVPGYEYIAQVSTDLRNWFSIQTNGAPFTCVDANLMGCTQRFYRALCRVP